MMQTNERGTFDASMFPFVTAEATFCLPKGKTYNSGAILGAP